MELNILKIFFPQAVTLNFYFKPSYALMYYILKVF